MKYPVHPAWFSLFIPLALAGCDQTALPPGNVVLLTGQEADAWSVDPPVATLRLEMVQDGARTTLAEVAAPVTNISLGHGGPQGVVASFEATGFDAQQNPVLHGATPKYTVQAFDDASLCIFVARQGGFARARGALQYEHRYPLLSVVPTSHLFIAGGDSMSSDPTQLDQFDGSQCSVLSNVAKLPQAARTVAALQTTFLLIGDSSTVWLDLVTGAYGTATAPTGLSFSEVIGGQALSAADGSAYVVGATRSTGDPTDKVLHIAADGSLQALVLSAPRLGAAAALVEGALIVAGGSGVGAGAEQLSAGATSFTALGLPPDATQGAGLAELNPSSAILAGGHDAGTGAASLTRTIDLGCSSACAASELPEVPLALERSQAFPLAASQVLVVGEAADGETHAFSIDLSGATPTSTEHVLRDRRAGASAILLPNGQVAVAGGDDPSSGVAVSSVELFFP